MIDIRRHPRRGKPTLTDFLLVLGITAAFLVEVDAVAQKQGARHTSGNAKRRTVHVHRAAGSSGWISSFVAVFELTHTRGAKRVV